MPRLRPELPQALRLEDPQQLPRWEEEPAQQPLPGHHPLPQGPRPCLERWGEHGGDQPLEMGWAVADPHADWPAPLEGLVRVKPGEGAAHIPDPLLHPPHHLPALQVPAQGPLPSGHAMQRHDSFLSPITDCKFNCHKRCVPFLPDECVGESPVLEGEDGDGPEPLDGERERDLNSGPSPNGHDQPEEAEAQGMEELDTSAETTEAEPHPTVSPCFSNYIPLMRVVQSFRHPKRRRSGILMEGWMVHCTSGDPMRKRHFWQLDSKSICLFHGESGGKC
uniref:Protein kinase C n=1 Tax=Sphenodon punctatus TaxID=8508 RepID=A0A8D0GQS9_SPHPU